MTTTSNQKPETLNSKWVPAWGLADVEQSEQQANPQPARQCSRIIASRTGWRLTLREEGEEIVICNGRGDVVFSFDRDEAATLAEAISTFPTP